MDNWEGIPGKWIEDATAIDGKRFVASRSGITKLRQRMKEAAGNRCEECRAFTHFGERHHIYGRGMGAGWIEDRPTVLGVVFVVWLCTECHRTAVIKPWGSWRNPPPVDSSVSQ